MQDGNVQGCIAALEESRDRGVIGRDVAQTRLAPLYSHEAQIAWHQGEMAQAAELANQALAAVPDFLPAALVRAQALVGLGQDTQAKAFIRRQWQNTPHPEFVDLYLRAVGKHG